MMVRPVQSLLELSLNNVCSTGVQQSDTASFDDLWFDDILQDHQQVEHSHYLLRLV